MYEHTGDKRLWLTADRERVVEDGDPEAAFLFVAPGGQLSTADAERYGLQNASQSQPDDSAAADNEALEQLITEQVKEQLAGEVRAEIETMQKEHDDEIAELEKQHAEEIAELKAQLEAATKEKAPEGDGSDGDSSSSKAVEGAPKNKAVSPDKDK